MRSTTMMTPSRKSIAFACLASAMAATTGAVMADWKPAGDRIKTRWAATVTPENAWREYPRPQMVREDWQSLNGLWDYAVRPKGAAEAPPEQWTGKILVPYCIESSLSGVGRLLEPEEELWYRCGFEVDAKGGRVLLHFEAVDYECEAWVNGHSVGTHKGGNTPFTFDVTKAAVEGNNTLLLRVLDPTADYQLRGKQVLKPGGIMYTRVSGIWQSVWLETVPDTYIERLKIDTAIDPATVTIRTFAGGCAAEKLEVRAKASFGGNEVASAAGSLAETVLEIADAKLWSVDAPQLYDLSIELLAGGKVIDRVTSYAGIRTIGKARDKQGHWRFTLNGKEIFHLGTLDQGWWPESLLTPPTEEAMRYDIDYLKSAGFNCIRNHIKIRPRRYYAYCDQIGMLVWQDQVSGPPHPKWTRMQPDPTDADWPQEAHDQFMFELRAMMDTLHNHPSIAVWVPFNEAWGQHRTMEIGKWTMNYDPSRLLNIASGGNFWPVGHIADHHNYPNPEFPDDSRFNDYIKVVGEFGGHGFVVDEKHLWNPKARNWGYGGLPQDRDELMDRYRKTNALLIELRKAGVAGGIYTQTSDIEGEVNGLLTYDREVRKFAPELLRELHAPLFQPELQKSR